MPKLRMGSGAGFRGLLLLALSIGGCGPDTLHNIRGTAWGSTWSLTAETNRDGQKLRVVIEDSLRSYEEVLSTYRGDSEITRLNQLKPGQSIRVSESMGQALELARELCHKSQGRFDPFIGQVMIAYGFEPGVPLAGSPGNGTPFGSHGSDPVPCGDLALSSGVFTRRNEDLLNLNAIAEGLVMQKIAGALVETGTRRFLFEFGGEMVAGDAPHSREGGWWVGVESPGTVQIAQTFNLRNAALSTSGTYRNVRGTHSHLIDSRSKRPLPAGPKSASVICPRAETADGVATILAIAPLDEAGALLRLFPGCEALVQGDGRVWHSNGWPGARP